jgi:hypothetical protein
LRFSVARRFLYNLLVGTSPIAALALAEETVAEEGAK